MRVEAEEGGRCSYLDGLRGVAACIVFFGHLVIAVFPTVVTFNPNEAHYSYEEAVGLSPLGWIWKGSYAVCIFFVLSGYVLAGFSQRTKLSVPAQVTRRYFRLALPMVITSFLAYVLMVSGCYKNLDAAAEVTKSGWLSMWYRAFDPSLFGMTREALYDAFVDGRANYNSNLWTMKIELIGSVALFLCYGTFRNVIARIGACLVFVYLFGKSYYSLFAIGVLCYELEVPLRRLLMRLFGTEERFEPVALAGLLAGLYLGAYPHIQSGMTASWHFFLPTRFSATTYHMMAAVMTVGSVLYSTTAQRMLGSAFGRYLGRLSFVLYLVHLPLICSLTAWSMYLLRGLPYSANAAFAFVLTTSVVFGLSTLLYVYVDVYTTLLSRSTGRKLDELFPEKLTTLKAGHSVSILADILTRKEAYEVAEKKVAVN